MCKIFFKALKGGKKLNGSRNGFFCDLDDKNIPFRKSLFTNYHISDENSIQIVGRIQFESCDVKNEMTITKDRKAFPNK